MFSRTLKDRIDHLIDDLFREGGIDSASLASILVAAQDSLEKGYHLELSRRVWSASNDLKRGHADQIGTVMDTDRHVRRRGGWPLV